VKDGEQTTYEESMRAYLQGKMSRAQLLKAVGVGTALAAIPGGAAAAGNSGTRSAPGLSFPFFPPTSGRYSTEGLVEIVSNLLTLKYFDATGGTLLLTSPSSALSALGVTGLALTVNQAVVAQDQYQIDFLQSLVPDAAPLTTTFTIDPAALSSPQAVAALGDFLGRLFIGAEITAAREFAELGQPTLAKYMTQWAAAEGESVGAFRALYAATNTPGYTPPDNKAFETDLFLYTRDAVDVLKAVGLIGGNGLKVPYPGRAAVLAASGPMATAVIQKAPNNAGSSILFTGLGSVTGERS
jgi:hypothetical protein